MFQLPKKLIVSISLLLFLISPALKAQFSLPDTIIVCGDSPIDIVMEYGISTSNILADIDSTNFTTVTLANDKFSPKIKLDFTFEFYGFDYTQIVLSSNCFLSFNKEYHHAFTPLIIDIALPNSSNTISANKVKNAILAPWHDIDPSQGGTIDYATIGTSPNRIFIARWMDVPHYNCTEITTCSAIFLYENGDIIETHIAAKPTCTTWNTGQAIHALQNDSGTVAEIVTDPYNNLERNYPNTWTTGLEGVRFTPDSTNDYSQNFIDFIPFVPVSDISWTNSLGDSIGSGDSISWDPADSYDDVDIIYIESPLCSTDLIDSIVIITDPSLAIIGPTNPLCVSFEDSLSINVDYADSILWSTGETTDSIAIQYEGSYSVQIFLDSCIFYDTLSIEVVDTNILDLGPDLNICFGDSILLNVGYPSGSYTWQDGSTDSIYYVTESGLYIVDLLVNNCPFSDSIYITVNPYPIVNLGADSLLCDGHSLILDAYQTGANYSWQDGSTGSNYIISQAGTYTASVEINGCVSSDTIEISYSPIPIIDLGPDQNICQGDTITLNAFFPNASYSWQDGSTDSLLIVTNSGNYTVDLTLNECTYTDSIQITVHEFPNFSLGNDTSICEGETLTLNIDTVNGNYLWQDGSNNSLYTINQSGIYSVIIDNNGCLSYDTIEVTVRPIPIINLGEEITICEGENTVLDAYFPGASYLWNTGSTDPSIHVDSAGLYSVNVYLNGCEYSDEVVVLVQAIPVIILPDYQVVCEGEYYEIDASYPDTNANHIWMDGSTDPFLYPAIEGLNIVTIELNGCYYTDSMFIEYVSVPNVNIEDTVICLGESCLFNAITPGASSYTWQDGSQSPTFLADEEGWYSVQVENEYCYTSDSAFLGFKTIPINGLPADTNLCEGETMEFDFENGDNSYVWQDSITTSSFSIDQEGVYSLNISNDCGSAKFTMQVFLEDCSCTLYIPNAFSPGNGGINETFEVFPDCELVYFSMKIFNRWGQQVFVSEDLEDEWDGTLRGGILAQDVYVYLFEYSFDKDRGYEKKIGTVTLLR